MKRNIFCYLIVSGMKEDDSSSDQNILQDRWAGILISLHAGSYFRLSDADFVLMIFQYIILETLSVCQTFETITK